MDNTTFVNDALALTQEDAEVLRYRTGVWTQDQYEAYMHVWCRNKIGGLAEAWQHVEPLPSVVELVAALDAALETYRASLHVKGVKR